MPRLPCLLVLSLAWALSWTGLPACSSEAPPAEEQELETAHLPIIGGTADSGHPAVGAVVLDYYLCTGTLVSPKIVVTAAHCTQTGYPIKKFALGPATDQATEILTVSKTIPHPQYGQQNLEGYVVNVHDIAVLVLSSAAKAAPMKMRSATIDGLQGAAITFVGFGVTVPGNSSTTGTKMKVASTIGTVNSQGFFNFTTPQNPKNTCTGDSGGPAVMNQSGSDEVIGVVSAGDAGCVQDGFNTRVDVHAAWIQGLIAQYDSGSVTPECGNGVCDAGESATSCPADCGTGEGCGNVSFQGCCNGDVLQWCEDGQLHEGDCQAAGKPSCGWNSQAGFYDCGTDGGADPSGANPKTCGSGPTQPVCGNGTCETGETVASCPGDCGTGQGCGDITYQGCCEGEVLKWCEDNEVHEGDCTAAGKPSCGWNSGAGYYDCGMDGSADPSGNYPKTCGSGPVQPVCGNGQCESGETAASCPADCQAAAVCGNGKCETGESAASCPGDCQAAAVCGNGQCEPGESLASCPADCKVVPGQCGNGACEPGESELSCPADCGAAAVAVCGNGKCENLETDASCPADCGDGANPACGDGWCDTDETCSTCPSDCGECAGDEAEGDGDDSGCTAARSGGAAAVPFLLFLAGLAFLLTNRVSRDSMRSRFDGRG